MHNFIKKTALSIGFDACGIAKAEELTEDAEFLRLWLKDGNHGEMSYLERNFEKRIDPRKLVPGCKSVVVVLLNYYPQESQPEAVPKIARYAYSQTDYHTILKTKLRELEQQIVAEFGEDCIAKEFQHSFVDSAPVLERRWAERAGLGWLGKHTQLISPGFGSFVFIGILLLNSEMEYDKPIRPKCGNCTKCIDACPTQALHNGSLEARKCISYLTIENKNTIPEEFHHHLSTCIIGCDICANVCPWNRKWAKPHNNIELKVVEEILQWTEKNWVEMDQQDFNRIFKNSAIKRAGFKKLKENIEILSNRE